MAAAMITTTPIPMSMSPTRKMLAKGTQAGSAKMSVSGSSAGCSRAALFD